VDIGGSTSSGNMTIGKNISGYSMFELVNQSVTGIYEKGVDLLTV
jgi:hypothetical protein